MPFQQLGLAVPIQQAVKESGYTEPTPIQVAAPKAAGQDAYVGVSDSSRRYNGFF